jgi:hypothetical protein
LRVGLTRQLGARGMVPLGVLDQVHAGLRDG